MTTLYCDRAAEVRQATKQEREEPRYCSECGERVVCSEESRADLVVVCVPCLVKDSPPHKPIVVHNSPDHCSECFLEMSRHAGFGKLVLSNWWGA